MKNDYDLIKASPNAASDVKNKIITLNNQNEQGKASNRYVLFEDGVDGAVESHCKDGFCGVCQCKLVEGAVVVKRDDVIAFVHEGNILACKSRIISRSIKIESNKQSNMGM